MVKCVAVVFVGDYSTWISIEVVGEEVGDAFGLVHFFVLVFWFRRRVAFIFPKGIQKETNEGGSF